MSEKNDLSTGLQTIDQFIKISKDIVKLPSLIKADTKGAANDFVEICQKILQGNENVVRWFYKFTYFDFTAPGAKKQFTKLKTDYEVLKTGKGYQKLKFDCHEIQGIYHRRISSKLGRLFQKRKLSEAKKVFDGLTMADAQMVKFVFEEVFGQLSEFANSVEVNFIDKNDLQTAEMLRLQFKVKSKDIVQRLQGFSNDLAGLVLEFSVMANKK